ncbi:MAG: DUF4417 domain-containing protein [Clostridia bacterium]|nr:DUF4417 domain-containing protein [Clostridia bacterium]
MTLENFEYRTSPLFLRNQFDESSEGGFKIPVIPKGDFAESDFEQLLLLGFDRAKANDTKLNNRMVHFFLYDYKFERVWKAPDKIIEKLKPYRGVLSPDFSMYREMNPTMQLYNTFRNRWCGAYFASKGLRVIPTISWGDENTFDFCFLGIPKGSTVAVSTYMVSEHESRKDQKEFFLKGYNEMLRQIQPERIICYNTPFPEMEGNIIFADYELSSWKYQNIDYQPSKYAKYITGALSLPPDCGIMIKRGFVVPDEVKGMGSAFGGEWKPKKPEDERFLGEPGEIKITILTNKKEQYRAETIIGSNRKAEYELHFTDHLRPNTHTNPHKHVINWDKGFPYFEKPQPYINNNMNQKIFEENKRLKMENVTQFSNFDNLSDFKWSLECGGEIEFEWNGKRFGIFKYMKKTPSSPEQILIGPSDITENEYPVVYADTIDEVLNYTIDGHILRDIIDQIDVLWRNI